MAPPEEVIRVVIGDQNLSFRAIADRSELRRIQRAAKRFSTIHSDNVILAEDRAFYDTDSETKALAFVLAETSLDPKLKPLDMLRLAKRAALAFEQIKDAVNRGHRKALSNADEAGIDEAKNGSGGMPSSASA